MHLFLTGPRQIGKSTIITKVVETLKKQGIMVGGFRTYPGEGADLNIYLNHYDQEKVYTVNHKAAYRTPSGATGIPEVFNTLGVACLAGQPCDLVIMDELGFLENEAIAFQMQVYTILDSDTPVLGVLKDRNIAWLESIKNHPEVEIIRVNEINRVDLPRFILSKFI